MTTSDIQPKRTEPSRAKGCFIYILVQSHFELLSSVLALEATEPVPEPVSQVAVELINNHLISVQHTPIYSRSLERKKVQAFCL